jgi:hypothetical protein
MFEVQIMCYKQLGLRAGGLDINVPILGIMHVVHLYLNHQQQRDETFYNIQLILHSKTIGKCISVSHKLFI